MDVYNIFFTPTGGTFKVADTLAKALSEGACHQIDLTVWHDEMPRCDFKYQDAVAVIAMPSYAGRVPGVAAERLSRMNGAGMKAVIVCVYGNRAYEDTLVELHDIAEKAGFAVIAAVAAIAEHSIARKYATGRPDEADRLVLTKYGDAIKRKLLSGDFSCPSIPGNRPYKDGMKAGPVPQPSDACTGCGTCAGQCPVAAIDTNDAAIVNKDACISCMRCVSVCPVSARHIPLAALQMLEQHLEPLCSARKECELFV